ncbi:hypothetical protein [Kibdelosporangium phytohabitans]|uniref:Lipoprotein n=1 Tax=Kibdelosporangium phytohabitans TaxID=860235 RepID=A0A0N9HQM4_9PSEU|nr:hypothetical protein [Kibdelosporangium phytohabitans]ALG07050.1 hypothetical protein AOZ06_09025 [Kibdelosporangium phytohabitans]MBE1468348.1 hypothetical protein [Kibdelosporangium phytohabitans]
MKNKVALVAVVASTAGVLMACSSSESKFADELKAAGFGTVKPTSETEKKTKKVGGKTVKSSTKVLEAVVRVKGCDLEFEKVSGQSGYWLDELHVNGQEPDWPGYPENLRKQQVEKMFADGGSKPDGFATCYKPNEA